MLFRSNWSLGQLQKCILLGNRLAEYVDNNSTERLKQQVPYLYAAAGALESIPLSPSKTWPTAFNNTCLQYFLPASIDKLKLLVGTPSLTRESGEEKELERGKREEGNSEDDDVLAAAVSSLKLLDRTS